MHESDKDDKDTTLNSFLFDLWRLHFSISGRHWFELELCHPFGGGAGFILDLQQCWRSHYFTIGAGHGRKDCIGTQVTDGVFSMQVATQRRYWKQQKKTQEKKARAIKNEQRAWSELHQFSSIRSCISSIPSCISSEDLHLPDEAASSSSPSHFLPPSSPTNLDTSSDRHPTKAY